MKLLQILLLLVSLLSCGGGGGSDSSGNGNPDGPVTSEDTRRDPLESVELVTPDGTVINASLADTAREQTQGLQNVQEEEFGVNDGKLFFYLRDSARTFWMPNTFFDLDIFYLDEELKIIEVVRDVPHYTGNVDSEIPRAPTITSRHVLEMKADSPVADNLNEQDVLQWRSSLTLEQTEERIREAN